EHGKGSTKSAGRFTIIDDAQKKTPACAGVFHICASPCPGKVGTGFPTRTCAKIRIAVGTTEPRGSVPCLSPRPSAHLVVGSPRPGRRRAADRRLPLRSIRSVLGSGPCRHRRCAPPSRERPTPAEFP